MRRSLKLQIKVIRGVGTLVRVSRLITLRHALQKKKHEAFER